MVGLLFIITFVVSIPAALVLYTPVLDHTDYILGAGADNRVALGAFLEMILIVANIGTAVVLFPILRRQNEALSLGYVTARVMESVFIAVGLLSLLAIVTLRQDLAGTAGADAAPLDTVGRSLVAVHDWTFLLGPGWVVGIGNGLLLGYLMYRSGLVPQTHDDAGADRRSADHHLGDRSAVRCHRARLLGAGHRDDPGVLLGVVARHLSHGQGNQAVSDHRWTTGRGDGVTCRPASLGCFRRRARMLGGQLKGSDETGGGQATTALAMG